MPDYIVTVVSTLTEKYLVAADNSDDAQMMVESGDVAGPYLSDANDSEIVSVFRDSLGEGRTV